MIVMKREETISMLRYEQRTCIESGKTESDGVEIGGEQFTCGLATKRESSGLSTVGRRSNARADAVHRERAGRWREIGQCNFGQLDGLISGRERAAVFLNLARSRGRTQARSTLLAGHAFACMLCVGS